MKTIIIRRKSGNVIIEMPDDADIQEVIREHEITKYESITVKKADHGLPENQFLHKSAR